MPGILVVFLVLNGVYLAIIVVLRLFLSPLADIPGPKLAALTYWYQSYYEFFPHRGQFLFKCDELHKKYGPVVRIGPDEVHINDPYFYNEAYGTSIRRRHKSPVYFWMGGMGSFGDQSMFGTLDHDLHRLRRNALGAYFSKRKVRELEPRLRAKVLLLRQRLLERAGRGSVNIRDAFGALTLDVISMYCLGRSLGALDRPDLGRKWSDLIHMAIKMNPFARAFPFIARRMLLMPQWMTSWSTTFLGATEFLDLANDLTRTAMREALADKASGKLTTADDADHRTVLHSMIQNEALPESEKSFTRLANDSLILIAAGYVTTSSTLSVTLYHILTKSDVRARLLAELRRTVMPSPTSPLPSVTDLERLPYLTAVVHEGTRIAHGVPGRLVRIAPDEDLHYRSRDGRFAYRIPSGTTFSQSTYLIHTNEDIYPRPFEFEPGRYYREPAAAGSDDGGGEDQQPTEAQRRLVPFGKGTRQCAATNLAYAELYLAIAAVVGTLDMEVAPGVMAKHATISSEFFAGLLPDKPGIRVNVIGELKA